jgi:hypothetical protein
MTDVAMENDGMGHTHTWGRDLGACVCGEPVPTWLVAAWQLYEAGGRG